MAKEMLSGQGEAQEKRQMVVYLLCHPAGYERKALKVTSLKSCPGQSQRD